MFELIDDLKKLIFDCKEYKDYVKAKELLEDDSTKKLLEKYQDSMKEYFSMKKYEKYTNISSLKENYVLTKKELDKNKIIQEYYSKYFILNELFDELTEIIFDNISDDLFNDRYML